MAILAFRTRSLATGRGRHGAAGGARRESLAIVSTDSELCGIAAYTAALRGQLDDIFDVTVFNLDQALLRSRYRRVRHIADAHVNEICSHLAEFDSVNLQLEHGTLGLEPRDIFRRFRWLAAAAARLSVTFHTLPSPLPLDGTGFLLTLLSCEFAKAGDMRREFERNRLLSNGIGRYLRKTQRRKQVTAIVHNRRDAHQLHYLHGIDRVLDHPLAFLSPTEAAAVHGRTSRRRFPALDHLPDDTKLIGVFGFLNDYKGFGTVIRALHQLPPEYHLLIFGGTHPNEIRVGQRIHPYLSALFDEAYANASVYEHISSRAGEYAPHLTLAADANLAALIGPHPRDLSSRIHFMGALPDADFLNGMAICDAAVFPYLEVGQSSSGPISQALELGCRIIASRTHAFLEFAKYHPQAFEFFDIGNHVELAAHIQARRQFPAVESPEFNTETNKAIYLLANSERGIAPAGPAARKTSAPSEEQAKR